MVEFVEMKTRSSLRESPMMTLGDIKYGRSAYSKQSENEEHVSARKRRTKVWCQVYQAFSRYNSKLETTSWRDSDLRQNEHADD